MAMTKDFLRSTTGETFDSLVLEAVQPVAVEFMSYGCEHCRLLEPILQEVARDLSIREVIFRVNIAASQELATRYEIEGTPTLVMFMRGNEVGRSVGPMPSVEVIRDVITGPFKGLA